jgi:hypothetical protein
LDVNTANGTPRIGKLSDEFVNENEPVEFLEL